MRSTAFICQALVLLFCLISSPGADAFANVGKAPYRSGSSLNMVFGKETALQIEKRKNPQQFEATIEGLMKTKKLTRAQAEKRYGEFLLDPDGFALRAAEEEIKRGGYKDWEEMAIARSDDPEATRERITKFKNKNRTRGIIIMSVFFAAAIASSVMNPYVPPGV
mmetsp:Transcript_17159/g.23004  ORF Transcript_17159/g.23004 Transcript_17159/m.23004 type:complete len:165 (-) Transcript_17159:344-838(-)|eukprot:10118237-Ditylum_brightwellii.AAC.1